MLVAGFLFGCMGVFVKLGAALFSSVELVFYRSLIGLLAILAVAGARRLPLRTRVWRNHLWRGLAGVTSLGLYFWCITVMPLATAVTLNYTSPLFLTLLTTWLLKERFHWPLVAAVIVGFAGVVLLLRPHLDEDQWLAGVLGLVSGVFAAFAYLNVRRLGRLGEPEYRTVFYFALVSTVAGGAGLVFTGVHPVTREGLGIILGMGTTATLAQLALTRAYRTGKTLVASALAYSTIVFASLFGMALWGEVLPLSAWIGMALIMGSGMLALKGAPRGS